MSLLSHPLAPPADPRTLIAGAYISCGANLYHVEGEDTCDRIALEDCRTLKIIGVQRSHVLNECTLVRAA